MKKTTMTRLVPRAVLMIGAVYLMLITAPTRISYGQPSCPNIGRLTITYSWRPDAVVVVQNSGVDYSAVDTALDNWNLGCHWPQFYQTDFAQAEVIFLDSVDLGSTGTFARGVTHLNTAQIVNGRLYAVDISINSNITNASTITEVMAHEIGHTHALGDCSGCSLHSSVMVADVSISNINDSIGLSGPNFCDRAAVLMVAPDYEDRDRDGYKDSACSGGNDCNDTNANINPGRPEICGDGIDNDCAGGDLSCNPCVPESCGVSTYWDPVQCCCVRTETGECQSPTPIILDVLGNGFDLTDATNGANFDLDNNGVRERLGWTRAGSDDAWLALDRNNNGAIDNGSELFGDFTPQPPPPQGILKNGFNALAEYDIPANGGNQDGQLDGKDNIFPILRLWQDTNHNGISEQNELHSLANLGVEIIELDYKESKRTDQHGNQFKYRAKVRDAHGVRVGRWAWDVFLMKKRQ